MQGVDTARKQSIQTALSLSAPLYHSFSWYLYTYQSLTFTFSMNQIFANKNPPPVSWVEYLIGCIDSEHLTSEEETNAFYRESDSWYRTLVMPHQWPVISEFHPSLSRALDQPVVPVYALKALYWHRTFTNYTLQHTFKPSKKWKCATLLYRVHLGKPVSCRSSASGWRLGYIKIKESEQVLGQYEYRDTSSLFLNKREERHYRARFNRSAKQYNRRDNNFWFLFNLSRGFINNTYRLSLVYHAWIVSSIFHALGPEFGPTGDFCVALLLAAAVKRSSFTDFCLHLAQDGSGLCSFFHYWGMNGYMKLTESVSPEKFTRVHLELTKITEETIHPVVLHWTKSVIDVWWPRRIEWIERVSEQDVSSLLLYMLKTPIEPRNFKCGFPFWAPVIYLQVIADATPFLEPAKKPSWYSNPPIPAFRDLVLSLVIKFIDEYYRANKDSEYPPACEQISGEVLIRLGSIWEKIFDGYKNIWEAREAYERVSEL
jgi:hypothetical protein